MLPLPRSPGKPAPTDASDSDFCLSAISSGDDSEPFVPGPNKAARKKVRQTKKKSSKSKSVLSPKSKSAVSPNKAPKKKAKQTKKKASLVASVVVVPPQAPKQCLQSYAAQFPAHLKPSEQSGGQSVGLFNRLLHSALQASPSSPASLPATLPAARSLPIVSEPVSIPSSSGVGGGPVPPRKNPRGSMCKVTGMQEGVVKLADLIQAETHQAWEKPDLGETVVASALRRAHDICDGKGLRLKGPDHKYILLCTKTPLQNRNASLNVAVKSSRGVPFEDAITFQFVQGPVATTYTVGLPELGVVARGFKMRAGDLDLSHIQTFLCRAFYFSTEPKPTSAKTARVAKRRFRCAEVGVDEKVVYSQFVAELQKIPTVLKLCDHYGVECVVQPRVAAAAAAIAVAAASSTFHASLQSPAPVSLQSPAPATCMPATAAASRTTELTPAVSEPQAEPPSRVGSVLMNMAALTAAELEELKRSLFPAMV